ncbi:hypothetical protein HYU23_01290 [Candidatus Woesearchaeota archaeon]|nr:hypothetical protein [Candidatus Woesearchaeota archaeon]
MRKKSEKFINIIFVFLIVISVVLLGYTLNNLFFPNNLSEKTDTMQIQTKSKMSLSSFDKQLAKAFMDKNNDG